MMITRIDTRVVEQLRQTLATYRPVDAILAAFGSKKITPFLVGGAVRDLMLGLPVKDLDIELHGGSLDEIEKVLQQFGPVSFVGKSFGVLLLHGLPVDWSLPRADSAGRKPDVIIDPAMDITQALRRRDLTMNAMAINLATKELIDPFGGMQDIQRRILRTPDEHFFVEDPLRFYRVMQFMARFAMQPDEQLTTLCSKMSIACVSVERIEGEFQKLLLQSPCPSLGIRWLHSIGRLAEILPELAATVGVVQDPIWHPEGDVFEHSMQCLDAAAVIVHENTTRRLILMYAALCHDIGKVSTTMLVNGRIKSLGHAGVGADLAGRLLYRITRKKEIIEAVVKLVKHHMEPLQLVIAGSKPPAYKRLARKLAPQISMLLMADLALADRLGRNGQGHEPLQGPDADVELFKQKAAASLVLEQAEEPVLKGRDLLDLIPPGRELGRVLKKAYDIQIQEGIRDKEELKKRLLGD